MTIDAVITWVDGNDPNLNAKRDKYGTATDFASNDVAGATRFANVGEIFWCVVSINRFAPWVNRIFIVTDGQNPNLEPLLAKHFPQGYIPMEIVDHTVIFKGYEQYLPVFNSISIETLLWRIPNLSEHFIYFNDDLMLLQPASPADFFTQQGIVSRVAWHSIVKEYFRRWLHIKYDPNNWTMVLAAHIMHASRYLKLYHIPRGLLRSWYEAFYEEHPDLIIENIQHRFRSDKQYSVMELQCLGLYKEGRNELKPIADYMFYLYPKPKSNYVVRKLEKLRKGNYKTCCLNSLDQATPEDRKLVVDYLKTILQI